MSYPPANTPPSNPEPPELTSVKGFSEIQKTKPWEWHIQETYKGLITLSVELLKILALVNGGAAVAILTFCGNLASRGASSNLTSFKPALSLYCAGLGLTLIAFIVAYGTQLRLYNEERRRHLGKAFYPFHAWLVGLGMFLTLCAAGAFIFGSMNAANVISPPGQPTGISISPK